jgi:hypothetical protein
MPTTAHRHSQYVIALTIILIMLAAPNIMASDDAVELYVNVGDTSMTRDADSVVISVFMETFVDSVGGFELWLFINQDEVLRFRSDSVWRSDTSYANCTDSNCTAWIEDSCIAYEYVPETCSDTIVDEGWVIEGATLTDGTLVENWDLITSNVLDEDKRSLKIVGIADQSGSGNAIPPNSGNSLLLKLVAEVRQDHLDSMGLVPDSLCPDSSHYFLGETQFVVWDNFSRFSDTKDGLIGWVWEYLCIDSTCIDYDSVGDSCITWQCIDWDETDSSGHVDTTKVKFFDGLVTLQCSACNWVGGDANASGNVDIDDVVYIITYIFGAGPAPMPELASGDANCSGNVDIDDVVYEITYIFGAGPPPCDCEDLP